MDELSQDPLTWSQWNASLNPKGKALLLEGEAWEGSEQAQGCILWSLVALSVCGILRGIFRISKKVTDTLEHRTSISVQDWSVGSLV